MYKVEKCDYHIRTVRTYKIASLLSYIGFIIDSHSQSETHSTQGIETGLVDYKCHTRSCSNRLISIEQNYVCTQQNINIQEYNIRSKD